MPLSTPALSRARKSLLSRFGTVVAGSAVIATAMAVAAPAADAVPTETSTTQASTAQQSSTQQSQLSARQRVHETWDGTGEPSTSERTSARTALLG